MKSVGALNRSRGFTVLLTQENPLNLVLLLVLIDITFYITRAKAGSLNQRFAMKLFW